MNKNDMKKTLLGLLGAMTTLAGCSDKNIQTVDATQFEQLVQAGKVQLLDVRTAGEYAEGFIPGAVNIDVNQSDFVEKAEQQLGKDRPVAVYCRSGHRSMMGAQQLVKAHYKVINLDGGIIAWSAAGKPTRRP